MTVTTVYSSFEDVPRVTYNPDHHIFLPVMTVLSTLADAERKTALYRERFLLVQHQLFQDARFGNGAESDRSMHLAPITLAGEPEVKVKSLKQLSLLKLAATDRVVITPVESLPGNPGIKFSYGFLSRIEE